MLHHSAIDSWQVWRYIHSNKNTSAWYFVRPALALTWVTVATIIRVLLLSVYFWIRDTSLSTIHFNQSHCVYINRNNNTFPYFEIRTLVQTHSISQASCIASCAARDAWGNQTVPFLQSADVAQTFECVLAIVIYFLVRETKSVSARNDSTKLSQNLYQKEETTRWLQQQTHIFCTHQQKIRTMAKSAIVNAIALGNGKVRLKLLKVKLNPSPKSSWS